MMLIAPPISSAVFGAPCTVTPIGERRVRVDCEQPHKAICKGQAVVFYDGDYLIGGGTIE